MSTYDQCVDTVGDDASAKEVLRCVVETMEAGEDPMEFSHQFLIVYSSALIFFMQSGFAMLCAGSVRLKNVGNTMLKNLLDACGASFAFYAVGFAIAYGGDDPNSPTKTFIGTTNFFLIGVEDLGFWLFQYAFSAASATIVAGTLAERCQMAAYLCYSVMLVGWVYPVVVHSVWSANGFLSAFNVEPLWGVGLLDFAGSGVVHMTGGITALFATIILGPRRGRFHDDDGRPLDKPKEFPGHSVALQMLGCFSLWFGWYGFNAGSALILTANRGSIAALVGVNTTLSAGMGGLSGLFVNLLVLERLTGEPFFDLKFAMNGTLSGLVAITAGCGFVEPWAAVIIGFVAGCIYIAGTHSVEYFRIDDAVDAVPVHLLNGAWGLFSTGLLASPTRLAAAFPERGGEHAGLFYDFSDPTLIGVQCIGILFICGWTMTIMLPFFVWLDWKGWFRSDPLEEIVGLDTSYHGGLVLGGTGDVQPEYITALKKKREEQKKSKKGGSNSNTEPYLSDNGDPNMVDTNNEPEYRYDDP